MADILSRILRTKQSEVAELRARRGFRRALESRLPAIIAEVKHRSPSKGVFSNAPFDPVRIAESYAANGASAISVLTDREYFGGSLDHLRLVRQAVGVPVLRKDFVIDEIQIAEAAVNGADAILLIAAALEVGRMRALREFAESFDLDVLVEAHNEEELSKALDGGASIVGVNNRDLATFAESLDVSLRLAEKIPANVLAVSESAIRSRADIERLRASGYRAFLVGESLMRQPGLLSEMAA
ncbi:MAG: indole-3-glycerol phosphate synthase TrpC [Bryobacteraceae bacterium]|nr:indole-3-glycerol phosphate synthase TrpC [Bryobacteraceae bacterium]